MSGITTHTIVRNEDRFIWYAIMSVIDHVDHMFIYDTGSTDNTVALINSIKNKKIHFQQYPTLSPPQITNLRQLQLQNTHTDWFMLLDGDEIWNTPTIKKFINFVRSQPKHTQAVVTRTRNCVGDIYHFLPESAGKYQLMGVTGHLSMRAYRKNPGYKWIGDYPLEAYSNRSGKPINKPENLAFFDNYYWHMTHLNRSSNLDNILGFRNFKYDLGIRIKSTNDLPEIFFSPDAPKFSNPTKPRSLAYTTTATILTPLKHIKRTLLS